MKSKGRTPLGLALRQPKEQLIPITEVPIVGRTEGAIVGKYGRWMIVGMVFAAGSLAGAADGSVLPGHTVDGNLDSRARMQAVHAEMRRECGANPGGLRCQRLKREFQQEARNCRKHRPR